MRTLIVVIALLLVVIQQPKVVFDGIYEYCLRSAPRLQLGVNGFEFETHIFDDTKLYTSILHSKKLRRRRKTNNPSLPLALNRGAVLRK